MYKYRLACQNCSVRTPLDEPYDHPHEVVSFTAVDDDMSLSVGRSFQNMAPHEARHLSIDRWLTPEESDDVSESCWFTIHDIFVATQTRIPRPKTRRVIEEEKPDVQPGIYTLPGPNLRHIRIPLPEHIGHWDCEDILMNGVCEKHTKHTMQFQEEDVYEMVEMGNVLNGNEMGLGKTIECILLGNLLNLWSEGRVLVVCPNSLVLNWTDEIKEWAVGLPELESDLDILCVTQLWVPGSIGGYPHTIASYEGVRKWGPMMNNEKWSLKWVDEAHYCKTPSAQRTIATFAVPADKVVLATGTPILNFPYELFPLIHQIDPGTWSDFPYFEGRYCEGADNKYGRNLEELQAKLRGEWSYPSWMESRYKEKYVQWNNHPHRGVDGDMYATPKLMIRRLKQDVLDQLPSKRRSVITLPADGKLAELVKMEKMLLASAEGQGFYNEILQSLNLIKDGGETDEEFAEILMALTVGRKYIFSEISRIRHQLALGKAPMVVEHVNNILETKGKVVVFCHHKDVAAVIRSGVEDFLKTQNGGQGYVAWVHGDMHKLDERHEEVKKFQNDENCRVFIGTLKAAGVGLTLTASANMVFAEMDWTPSVLTQAEDRCHRIGQTASLLIQHLVVDGSMDAFMAKKIIAKQKSISKALNRGKSQSDWK